MVQIETNGQPVVGHISAVFPLSEMKDSHVTTLHFSTFAARQMYSGIILCQGRPAFFNSILRSNFLLLLLLRAKQKEQVSFAMFPFLTHLLQLGYCSTSRCLSMAGSYVQTKKTSVP